MILPLLFSFTTLIIIIFQFCLALGLPWGSASMGGKFPGKYPKRMRYVAIVNMFFLSFLVVVVLSKAKLFFLNLSSFSNYAIWIVVVFSFISVILNSITQSKIERIWIPATIIMFVSSLSTALMY